MVALAIVTFAANQRISYIISHDSSPSGMNKVGVSNTNAGIMAEKRGKKSSTVKLVKIFG
jgi:hypothetical protein